MTGVLQEFLSLLIQPAGSLIYHTILAFSVAASLSSAWNFARSANYPHSSRLIAGLLPILLILLVSFLLGSLAWQGILPENKILPPLERGVTLFSLILIAWLWIFPQPSRLGDITTLSFALLTLALTVVNIAWWFSQTNPGSYNATSLDRVIQAMCFLFTVVGSILLLIRRSSAWQYGVVMLVLLSIGHLLQLLIPDFQQEYATPVRLTQLAAFPLLLTLPSRYIVSTSQLQVVPTTPSTEKIPAISDPRFYQSILYLTTLTNLPELYKEITRTVSRLMQAEVCLLLSPPDISWKLMVPTAYFAEQDHFSDQFELNGNQIPLIAAALRHSRSFQIPESKTTQDLLNLARSLNIAHTGDLLGAPILDAEHKPRFALLILSPGSNRVWTKEDKSMLIEIAHSLARLLQQKQAQEEMISEFTHLHQNVQAAQAELHQAKSTLIKPVQFDMNESGSISPLPTTSPEEEALQGELRLALEELSQLRTASDASSSSPQDTLLAQQMQRLSSLIIELHQPASSISGNIDFLLSETAGDLSELQRKFLERIKSESNRMVTDLEKMRQIAEGQRSILELEMQNVQLSEIIDKAVQKCADGFKSKEINLQVDLPQVLPVLQTDAKVLGQVLCYLLQNATKVTPKNGQISIHLEFKADEENKGFVVLQVADQGGGIASENLAHVFSRIYRLPVPGTGDTGIGFSIIKTLVETIGGRIWVDTDPGVGAVFSVLLPISTRELMIEKSDRSWNQEV